MRQRAWLVLAAALAWLGCGLGAWAKEPVVLSFTEIGIAPKMEPDADMNRVFAEQLAARGIEVHLVSPFRSSNLPDPDAVFSGNATVERTGVTRVRSSRNDSPSTETMSFARCHLLLCQDDEDENSKPLFDGAVIVPLTGEPPELVPAVPTALAERIADVVEAARLEEPVLVEGQRSKVEGQELDADGNRQKATAIEGNREEEEKR